MSNDKAKKNIIALSPNTVLKRLSETSRQDLRAQTVELRRIAIPENPVVRAAMNICGEVGRNLGVLLNDETKERLSSG